MLKIHKASSNYILPV